MMKNVLLEHVNLGISSKENDQADKEFLASLKGEKDTTVVA